MSKVVTAVAATLIAVSSWGWTEGEKAKPKSPSHPWHFSGLTGQHDISQVQRGFQVYWAKCAACHGMEFRRFWHLEKIGYTEGEVKSMIAVYLAGRGESFDTSTYSIQNMPESRVAGAPDLSHAVLAKGKTMEQGADYIYSLLLGYDRMNDAVLGPASRMDRNEDAAAYVAVGAPVIARFDNGDIKSITRKFEKNNFYLYGSGQEWVLRNFVDIRTDFQEFDSDGTALPLVQSFGHRLDETDPHQERKHAAAHAGYEALEDADSAWTHRGDAHSHSLATWAAGQFYNPFKSGGVLSMASPLVDLENFHRTDFSAEDLIADAADLENATYWLVANQDLQPRILEAVEAARAAYEAVPAGLLPAQDRAAAAARDELQGLINQLHPETKKALSEDVVAWLAFSSDMNLNARKETGLWVVVILAILSVLLYFFYREIARQEFAKQAKYGGPWDDNH